MFYIWRIYNRIRKRCGSSGFGASPMSWSDIDAFSRNTGFKLSPWEVQLLEDLDDVFLHHPRPTDN